MLLYNTFMSTFNTMANLAGNLAMASAISSNPNMYNTYQTYQGFQWYHFAIGFGVFMLIMFVVMFVFKSPTKKEKFTNFPHRSNLASTLWMSKPQIQHSFPELGLQYPDHNDYFNNSCDEKEPHNAELCRYHKHRFDPNQM